MNIGILNAIVTEYQQRVNPSRDAQKFTEITTTNGAASSAVSDATKLGTNFKSSNDNKPKRSVAQVQDSVKEAIDFLNTPEGRIIAAIA